MFNKQIDNLDTAQRKLSGLCIRCGVYDAVTGYECSDCYMYDILPDVIQKKIDQEILDYVITAAKCK